MTLWAMRYFLKYEHYLNKHLWFGFCSSASVSITQTETWDFFFFSPKPKGFYRTWKLTDRIFKKKREHAEFLIWYVLIYLITWIYISHFAILESTKEFCWIEDQTYQAIWTDFMYFVYDYYHLWL